MIFFKLIIIKNSSLDTDANWQVTKTTVKLTFCVEIFSADWWVILKEKQQQ